MRIAIVSDIHGNLPALEAVAADMQKRGIRTAINLGDSLSGPLLPKETARFLRAQEWTHLAGNHERQVMNAKHAAHPGRDDLFTYGRLDAEDFAWIAGLTATMEYDSDIYLCHASPRSDLEYLLETVDENGMRAATQAEIEERLDGQSAPVVLCGHSHVPRIVRTDKGQLLINPGSVGRPAFDGDLPFYHRVENGTPDARYAVLERAFGEWQTELIAVPYDHSAMSQLAAERGFDDWARELATGRVA